MQPELLQEVAQATATAASAFWATNIDDILLLLLLFSGTGNHQAPWPVISGQYLGFALLILASLAGFLGGQLLPSQWFGILGLLPVGFGVSQVIEGLHPAPQDAAPFAPSAGGSLAAATPAWLLQLGCPGSQVIAIAGLTLANGGDNLGLYMPLFAHANTVELTTMLVVFFLLVGVWCVVAWRLVGSPGVAERISRYGRRLVPLVLIGLGVVILLDSHIFSSRPLAVMVLAALLAMACSMLRHLQHLLTPPIPPDVG